MSVYKVLVVALSVLILPSAGYAFSYATGACATGGCASGETFLDTNANELDTALDALEARDTIAEHESLETINVILETDMDASSELRALMDDESGTGALLFADGAIGAATATTAAADDNDTSVATTAFVQTELADLLAGASVVLDSDIGVTVQALDADLTDLADGSLSGSKIGTGLDITTATAGTLATARMSSSATLDSEWDTAAEINAITTDQDFMTQTSTLSFLTTGAISGKVGLNSVGVGGSITATGMLGNLHYYTGAGAATFNLPTPVEAGLNACFYTSTTAVLTIDVGGGSETITLDGLPLSGGDSIDSPGEAGSLICLLGTSTTNWTTLGRSGTWIDGN